MVLGYTPGVSPGICSHQVSLTETKFTVGGCVKTWQEALVYLPNWNLCQVQQDFHWTLSETKYFVTRAFCVLYEVWVVFFSFSVQGVAKALPII